MIPPLLTPYISLVAAITSVVNYGILICPQTPPGLVVAIPPNDQCNRPGGSSVLYRLMDSRELPNIGVSNLLSSGYSTYHFQI